MNSKKLFGIALAAMLLSPVMPAQAALSEKACKQAWAIGKVVGGLVITAAAGMAMSLVVKRHKARVSPQPPFMGGAIMSLHPMDTGEALACVVNYFAIFGGLTLAGFGVKELFKK